MTTVLNWGTINDVQYIFLRLTTTWYDRFLILHDLHACKSRARNDKFHVFSAEKQTDHLDDCPNAFHNIISVMLNLISTELVVRLRLDKTTRWSHSRLLLVATSLSPKPPAPPSSPLPPLRTRCPALFAILLRCIAAFRTWR